VSVSTDFFVGKFFLFFFIFSFEDLRCLERSCHFPTLYGSLGCK